MSEVKTYAQSVNRVAGASVGCSKLRQSNFFLNRLTRLGLYRPGAYQPVQHLWIFCLTNALTGSNTPFLGGVATTYVTANPGWSSSGIAFNGTTGYGNIGVNPTNYLASPSGHLAAWKTVKGASNGAIGAQNNNANEGLFMGIESTQSFFAVNVSTENLTGATSLDVAGFQIVTRLNNTMSYWRNGVSQLNSTVTQTVIPNQNLFIGNVNTAPSATTYFNTDRYMAVSTGGGLSDSQATDFYQLLLALKAGIFA